MVWAQNQQQRRLFETGLPISDYCEPDVAPPERKPFIGEFKVTANLKLARI